MQRQEKVALNYVIQQLENITLQYIPENKQCIITNDIIKKVCKISKTVM